jgi:hypothetical protein
VTNEGKPQSNENNYFVILYVEDKEVQTGSSPNPEKDDQLEEQIIHTPFCRDPREISSGKSSLEQDRERKLTDQNNAYQPGDCSQLPTLQYRNLKSYGYKKAEVYNPGKARRLEVRF